MWWNVDCGVDKKRFDAERFMYWDEDELLTHSGINAEINSTTKVPQEMNTLRFFPNGT